MSKARWLSAVVIPLLVACGSAPEAPPSETEARAQASAVTVFPVFLDYATFRASGAGATTTNGSVSVGSSNLVVSSGATWSSGHGVRVSRAGVARTLLSTSVNCTTLSPACALAIVPGGDVAYDELSIRLRSSAAVAAGDLQVELTGPDGLAKMQMPLPALAAATTTTSVVRLQARKGPRRRAADFAVDDVRLRCLRNCTNLTATVDRLELLQDLVAKVSSIGAGPQGSAILRLDRTASKSVSSTTVYHDDTKAVQDWLDFEPARPHKAPAGVYYLSKVPLGSAVLIPSKTTIVGDGPEATIFKSSGGANTGLSLLFVSCAATVCGTARYCADDAGCSATPSDITIRNCGFDMNGTNSIDFAGAVMIGGNGTHALPAHDITIEDNRFFDSVYDADPAFGKQDCDRGMDECAMRQRQSIVVGYARDVTVQDNVLSGGGRLKLGGPGTRLKILRNQIDFVNDNAITVVQAAGPTVPCVATSVEAPPASGVPCLSNDIEIRDNFVKNAVGGGIFFGADGEPYDNAAMRVENVTIANNRIEGHFIQGIQGTLPGGGANNVTIRDNIVWAYRPRAILPNVFTAGISLARGNSGSTVPSTGVVLAGNTVSNGPFGAYRLGGAYILGPMTAPHLSANSIRCTHCSGNTFMETALFLAGAGIDDALIEYNTFSDAYVNVRVDAPLSNARFSTNTISNARAGAQVALNPPTGTTLSASLYANTITNGAAQGIFCVPTGATFSTWIGTNNYSGNAGGNVVGCP